MIAFVLLLIETQEFNDVEKVKSGVVSNDTKHFHRSTKIKILSRRVPGSPLSKSKAQKVIVQNSRKEFYFEYFQYYCTK